MKRNRTYTTVVLLALAMTTTRTQADRNTVDDQDATRVPLTPSQRQPIVLDLDGVHVILDLDKGLAIVEGFGVAETPRATNSLFRLISSHEDIKQIIIRRAYIQDGALRHLSGLPRLKAFALAQTNVSDAMLRDLADIEGLEEISVNGGLLTDRSVLTFGQMHRLRSLSLTRLPFLPISVNERLNILLPHTKLNLDDADDIGGDDRTDS